MATKTNKQIALEVMAGEWGSSDERKAELEKAGYDYEKVQEKVTELATNKATAVKGMNAWATKIANDNSYHYKLWRDSEPKTKKCPICEGYPKDASTSSPSKSILGLHGWNCIGFAFAVWHHGGKIGSACNCHVIADDTAMRILNAKTDAEALKIAKQFIKVDNLMVIRGKDGKNIPKSKWQAGDIMCQFVGNKYTHMFYYRGNNKITDAKGSAGKIAPDKQIATRSADKYSARIIFRYLGDFNKETKSTSVKTNYYGRLPSIKLVKTNAEVINDTIKWAKWIAGDNTFHYGHGKDAHHNGCYFCGTQPSSKKNAGIVDYKHTYCCNPFVGAAWAHGGCVPKALELCSHGSSWDFTKGHGYDASSLFDNLGKPARSKLKKGDVLCGEHHVALYIGDGKIAEAAGGDDNKKGSTSWNKSIRVTELTSSRYAGFKRVHRFNSKVDTKMNISHGECGDRVKLWQAYLDWYFDGKVGTADGYFGDNTLKWTKKFQEKEIGKGTGDGIVGEKTLKAAALVVK